MPFCCSPLLNLESTGCEQRYKNLTKELMQKFFFIKWMTGTQKIQELSKYVKFLLSGLTIISWFQILDYEYNLIFFHVSSKWM